MPLKSTTKSHLYPIFLVLLPIIFTVVVVIGYSEAKKLYFQSGVHAMDRQLNTVTQILSLFNDQVKDGLLSYTAAENQIRDMMVGPKLPDQTRDRTQVKLTLAQGDELFAFNSQGTYIVHNSLEGQNMYNLPNQGDRFLVKQTLDEGKKFSTYRWSLPDGSSSMEKIAVVRYFPQWDWYICLVSTESEFYEQFTKVKVFLILLVVGSYLIAAILFTLTYRKEKALLSSNLRGEQLAEVNQSILKSLAVALEERDSYTSGHSQRVAYYMHVIGKQMGLDERTLDLMYTGGLLHDIGKIGIEDSILLKPGKLTDEEFHSIKSHPVRGEALLRKLYAQVDKKDAAGIRCILAITRHHHERFDGKGYPDQLQKDDIPIFARVTAVADSFDAMTSSRAYRKGLSFSKACDEIIRNKGTQFCPKVVDAFFQSITEETFHHAHQISRANELLDPLVMEQRAHLA
ncbi:HD domain-containing phosphohydrolase [Brevibacillus choshinensis]|uniref:Cache domain-containing protein n=1 Tax=Brevibacillus choshinensis TaxID=54911 RepID=A0ABX7FIR3_BRECH|nr:HD domain-containing phosphohydrolase [Brevibacillus choshinensis]QRG66121.1 cache domain-containing protein [Brevibacillus choshinensis]